MTRESKCTTGCSGRTVAETPNRPPWLLRSQLLGLLAKTHRCLADHEQRVLHREDRLLIFLEAVFIKTSGEPFDATDVLEDVLEGLTRIAKRHARPLARPVDVCRP